MKKLHAILAGIVFIIAILAADCGGKKSENGNSSAAYDSLIVYLKDTTMRGKKHLLMSDSRKLECGVIDNLQTVVNPGDTVFFMKGQHSKVKTIDTIYLVNQKEKVFNIETIRGKVLYVLEIDPLTPTDTIVKYVIVFTHKDYGDSLFSIDPYLRIPPP